MKRIAPYAKAITGAVVAALVALKVSLADEVVTAAEGTDIGIAFLTGLALVWAVPNKDHEAEHQDESVQSPERPSLFDEE